MRTPNETHRLLRHLQEQSSTNDVTFRRFDKENVSRGVPEGTGNAAYIVVQAKDYHETLLKAAAQPVEFRRAYLAHARSEAARILALIQRECGRYGWDLLELLQEGVEYETEVARTRTADSAKYLQRE